MTFKKLSIIIPAYNEEKYIGACLKSLNEQSLKNFEVIVVDDGSTDNTREIVKSFKNVKLIEGQHRGPGFSRNLGAKKARGKYLVFVDADMTFDKDYLRNLISPMEKDKKIIGTTHCYEEAINVSNIWSMLFGKIRVSFPKKFEGYNKEAVIFRAIRRKKFLELGGFDPKYGYADDQTFWIRDKIRPYVAPNTICYHRNPETLKEVYKQSRWIGASIESFWIKNKITKYIYPIILILISPFAIMFLSVKKTFQNKKYNLFVPWMILFMSFRYFGTVSGIIRRVYKNINFR